MYNGIWFVLYSALIVLPVVALPGLCKPLQLGKRATTLSPTLTKESSTKTTGPDAVCRVSSSNKNLRTGASCSKESAASLRLLGSKSWRILEALMQSFTFNKTAPTSPTGLRGSPE